MFRFEERERAELMGKVDARRDSEKSSTLTPSVKCSPMTERSFNTLIRSLQAMFRALSFMVLWWIPLVLYGSTLAASEAPAGSTIRTSSGCFTTVRTSLFRSLFRNVRERFLDLVDESSIVGDRRSGIYSENSLVVP